MKKQELKKTEIIRKLDNHSQCGSDHFFHLSLISRIKENSNTVLESNLFTLNERYPLYPQLFHWILSYLKPQFYQNHILINRWLQILESISIYSILAILAKQSSLELNIVSITIFSILVFTIPQGGIFSWNSRNRGLSPRIFGSILVNIFIINYLIFTDISQLIMVLFATIIIFLTSQFAFQYVLFFGIIHLVLFFDYNLLLGSIIGVLFVYLVAPNYTLRFLKGQFYHKRNYALYLSKIFLLNIRTSIWRDFIWDFYKKSFRSRNARLTYILTNPLIELILATSSILILWYFNQFNWVSENSKIDKILISTILIFLATSFKKSRFLGEPHRYVYFIIPILGFLGLKLSLQVSSLYLIISLTPNILLTGLRFYLAKHPKTINYMDVLHYFNSKSYINKVVLCDNSNVAKSLMAFGLLTYRFDLSKKINSLDTFKKYHPDNYEYLSFDILEEINKTQPINLRLLSNHRIPELIKDKSSLVENCITIYRFKSYTLYEVINQ